MSKCERILLGTFSGLIAVISKFMAQDYHFLVANFANLTSDQVLNFKVGYGILTPVLVVMGGFIAWLSDEEKRMKVAALAISAPALITTWAGGGDPTSKRWTSGNPFFSNAYAQTAPRDDRKAAGQPEAANAVGAWERVQRGVGVFFGHGKEPIRYRVIVGSFTERAAALEFANQINAESKTLNAWVADRRPGNPHYPVVIGEYNYQTRANEIRTQALKLPLIKEAYLSPEPPS